jgi:hypothetical protein
VSTVNRPSQGSRTAGGRSGSDDQRRRDVALLTLVLCQPMDRGWAVYEWAEEALWALAVAVGEAVSGLPMDVGW